MKRNWSFQTKKILHPGQVVYQAGANYPGFSSMKQLGVFLLLLEWDASPSQDYPPALNSQVPVYTPVWTEVPCVRVKYLAREHNTMLPARA